VILGHHIFYVSLVFMPHSINSRHSHYQNQQESEERFEKVSLMRCAPETDDAAVMQKTQECIGLLGDLPVEIKNARTIAVKINAGIHRVVTLHGKQTELTDPAVVEGTIRALRAVTDAELLVGDAPTDGDAAALYAKLGLPERLSRYPGVRLVDFNASELVDVEMPHSQPMFSRYTLPRELAQADAFVSVAKMKAHASMGCTLCIKNLFGWMPTSVYGAPRMYLHDRLIRLPRVLSDMAQWMRPSLNVIDGIVALNKQEWHGETLSPGLLLAGTNIVATDSVGARAMGFNPQGDYPEAPFHYRRNTIELAAQAGLGPNASDKIQVIGPTPEEVATPFDVEAYEGNTRRPEQLQRGAECVAQYRAQQAELASRYHGRYLALFDGEVLWDGPDMKTMQRLEHESGRDWQNVPQFVVRCVPPDEEIENLDWYAHEAQFAAEKVLHQAELAV
jgi:uncharacterized protein (DUF362 family)